MYLPSCISRTNAFPVALRGTLPDRRHCTAGGARMKTPVYAIIDLKSRTSKRYEIDYGDV